MVSAQARAVRFDRYGGREELYVADIDRPSPSAGEVLVEGRAAGINPGEIGIRSGALHERFPATHTAVPVDQLIHKPAELSWEVAGSLYVVGVTAYAAVRAVAPQPGETVAVSAAAGGVGRLVVQLLALGDVRVLGIAGAGNADWLRT